MPSMIQLRVGKEAVVKNEDLDVIKTHCTAFGIRSRRGQCDKLIRITQGRKLIAKSHNWNQIVALMEEWESRQ